MAEARGFLAPNFVKITFVDGEDRQLLLKPNGDELCSIDRDEDSFSAAVKVIRSLGL